MHWVRVSRYHAETREGYSICWDGRPEGERKYLAWAPGGRQLLGVTGSADEAKAMCEQHKGAAA